MKKIKPIKISKDTTNSIPERTIETTNCIPERTIELPIVGNDKVWALKLAEKKPAQTDRELMGKLTDILDGKIEEIIRANTLSMGLKVMRVPTLSSQMIEINY